jgi:hypothetical protein
MIATTHVTVNAFPFWFWVKNKRISISMSIICSKVDLLFVTTMGIPLAHMSEIFNNPPPMLLQSARED